MARLSLATRTVMKLDVLSVRWTGNSFFMWLFAWRTGLAKHPNFESRKAQALVLVTSGRRTGRERSVVLPYFTFEGKTFVVASKGGAPDDPDWLGNLRATPAATVFIGRRAKNVITRIATKEERATLWPRLVALAPTYEAYQKGTRREIPLVIIC
jgi:deazaflavin-dependent oxidoreductase (nitroreductase family)